MTAPLPIPIRPAVDLTAPAPLAEAADLLARRSIAPQLAESLKDATAAERPRERNRKIAELFRKLEHDPAAELLLAAAAQALAREAAGARLLCGFMEVTRPGAEVLGQLRGLPSLRRVSLKITSGTWREPEDSVEVHPAQPIVAVLEEGARLGTLDLELNELPGDRIALGAINHYLSAWFDRIASSLEAGQKLPEELLLFITQLAMLEVTLLEKRVSRLASAIDPYDMRRIAKLLPFLSRLDQDIEHMKDVVSRISTYEPFWERTMTVEQAMTSRELDKLLQLLAGDRAGAALGRIVTAMRQRPVLSHEYACSVAQLHRIAQLRRQRLPSAKAPDLLSILLLAVECRQDDQSLAIAMEPEVATAIWEEVATWGAQRPSPGTIVLSYREGLDHEFVAADGTPLLGEDVKKRELSLSDLIRKQIDNDPFILGLLDNPKVMAMPGLIPMLARDSRSLRVLERIIRVRRLHTGAANRDVPRRLLANPAHIPVSSLRAFIHVRFVSKTDLRHMSRRGSDVRGEVAKEITSYLEKLG
ncbi:MAG TPA: hypothetical protein VNM87_03395 [Candidatus Udaeobacter sp.]|nr:hypothetical protein [Candidatus Udaeobacter sp.]